MSPVKRLNQIEGWSPQRLRSYLIDHHPEDYRLIDVRSLQEYGKHHLPGALWVQAEDLPHKLDSLDNDKSLLVYCALGALSRTAAEILVKAGYKHVYFLEGGLHAWAYGVSSHLPQNSSASLLNAENAEEQALNAWQLEEAARIFYTQMAESIDDAAAAGLFADLAIAESHHKTTLKCLWEALSGKPADDGFPGRSLTDDQMMEGGARLKDVLKWAKQSSTAQIIDYAMAMELNAYDQYLFMQRSSSDPNSQRLFEVLADEERHHLRSLTQTLEKLEETA